MDDKWDNRFLKLADHISSWSLDPSTKVGAVIVDKDRRVISTGYNGYPKGIADTIDTDERAIKYRKVLHAEKNAILFSKQDLTGCTLYVTHRPCSQCAAYIIQSGIKTVVTNWNLDFDARHKEDQGISLDMLTEGGVEMILYV